MMNLGAPKLAPSVSTVDAAGTLATGSSTLLPNSTMTSTGTTAKTGERNLIDELLNSVPVQDALPPRNDARSRSRHIQQQQNYALGSAAMPARNGDTATDVPRGIGWPTMASSSYRSQHRARLPSLDEQSAFGETATAVGGGKSALQSRAGSSANLAGTAGANTTSAAAVVDLETFVPTYPMELLPGQSGEKRKRYVNSSHSFFLSLSLYADHCYFYPTGCSTSAAIKKILFGYLLANGPPFLGD